MCCLKNNGMCYLCRDFQLSLFQNLLKNFGAGTKIEPSGYLTDDVSNTLYPPSPSESKPTQAELASDLLQQLETQCKQENIFSNWLEEKVDLPIFENISQVPDRVDVPEVAAVPPYSAIPIAPQPTEDLLREAQPPLPQQDQWPVSIPPTVPDFEYQALEELVRHRAAQLTSPIPSGDSATPASSPPSSPRSCSTDDEWSSCRPKPYTRNVDDRRSRKKEQNKNAATRYRQKKKAEIEVLLNEEQNLRQRHVELGDKCSDLQREIKYLKGLMRDLFKAKGLIK
ncbi:unnamed protein product [Pieris macdunnoughi]|uniref:BZIP domain-containing protein n=1 Tax=Pieris macdunnoughi TaxID=345717 RepID=A0A821VKS0_9NEOP|nr:unnamed protein product [Pieris macdunnoughi]